MEDNEEHNTKWKPIEIMMLITLVLSLFLEFFVFSLGDIPGSLILRLELSGLLLFAGLSIILLARYSLSKSKQLTVHGEPSKALVTTGIFKYSRNPIYASILISLVGAGLIFNNIWVIVLIIPLGLAIHRILILPEEVNLVKKFGDEYLHYMNRVRRWL